MRTLIPVVTILLLAVGAALWWGHLANWNHTPPRPAILVISGDTAGWITPCGCTANQSGGLLRRGGYIANLRKSDDVIYADVGGAPAGVSPYQRVKFEAVLAGEIAMGIAAHNIGGPEAMLGADYLRGVATQTKCPLISANCRTVAGQPLAESVRIVHAGDRRVALVGILSPRFATADVQVGEARQAVLEALERVRGKYDLAIVLAYCPEDELSQLAGELPEVDAIVGGPTGQAMNPRSVGRSLVAAATNKGKFLVQFDIPAAASQDKLDGKVVEMGPALADQDVQLANLKEYLKILAARDFPAAESGFVPAAPANEPADYRIAGSESCRSCHGAEMQSWSASGHAHAWQTLQPRGFHVDPYCLQCHTTGYGLPGGFDSARRSPTLGGVGCENCHGPSTAHTKDPKIRTPFVAADQCIRCHDRENSPNFEYAGFWSRIQHGRK